MRKLSSDFTHISLLFKQFIVGGFLGSWCLSAQHNLEGCSFGCSENPHLVHQGRCNLTWAACPLLQNIFNFDPLPSGGANKFSTKCLSVAPKQKYMLCVAIKRSPVAKCVSHRQRPSVSLSCRNSSQDNERLRTVDNGKWSMSCRHAVNGVWACFALASAVKLQGCAWSVEKG